jgi:pimeloyl-ACP methyl ester carboxylesterase
MSQTSEPRSRFLESSPRLHFLEWNPNGKRTVVFLHGNSANAWWWQWVANEFGKEFRLLAIDQRGHGDSEWVKPPAYQPYDYADDLARFIREIGASEPAGKPFVVGHSMGGLGTLAFASRYPDEARAAVIIDTAVVSNKGRDRFLRRLKVLPTVVYPDFETAMARFRLMPDEGGIPKERLATIAEKSLMRTEQGGYTMKFDRESFFGGDGIPVLDTIRDVRIPTLLVRAQMSRIMTQEASELASASNPNVELVVIPHAHHHVILEKPREVAAAVVDFIDNL